MQGRKNSLAMVCSLSRDGVLMKTLSIQILNVWLVLVTAYSCKTLMDDQKYEIKTALPGQVHKDPVHGWVGVNPEHRQSIIKLPANYMQ